MIQKILACALVLVLCLESIFRFSLTIPSARADELLTHENIVSLIVEQEMYDTIKADIQRYAQRIQSRIPDTSVSIFPIAKDTHPYVISLLNERLYFSGVPDASDRISQRLVGTILMGDIALPVVHRDTASFVSVFPYVDFDEPHFFYDTESDRFEYIDELRDNPEADIWHTVIHPNTGSLEEDTQKVLDFFERSYAFDAKEGMYENLSQDPQVLYMDVDQESLSLRAAGWSMYNQITRKYFQKMSYRHWTQSFARFVQESYMRFNETNGSYEAPDFTSWQLEDDAYSYFEGAPDIGMKMVIEEMMISFLDAINPAYIEDVSEYVHNTGRYYNGGSDVRVDTLPEVITKKDLAAHELVRQLNTVFESKINDIVENDLARDIAVLSHEDVSETIFYEDGIRGRVSRTYNFTYDNYMFGQKVSTISDASQCSIMRGSESRPGESALVEANKGYNVIASEQDLAALNPDFSAGIACSSPLAMTQTYWGGNSTINLSFDGTGRDLGTHRYDTFVRPIFDIAGSKKVDPASGLSIQKPSDCFQNNMIMRPFDHQGYRRQYRWPQETSGTRYSCATQLSGTIGSPFTLNVVQDNSLRFESVAGRCSGTDNSVRLLGRDGSLQSTCDGSNRRLTFKRIPSVIYHVSPTDEEYGIQLNNLSAPNLPIDARRYVDFIALNGKELRYNYPNIYNLSVEPADSRADIADKLKTYIDAYSRDMNTLINEADPSSLTQAQKLLAIQLSDRTSISGYPSANVDFYSILETNSPLFEQLVDAIYWLHIDNVAKKYEQALLDTLVYDGGQMEQLTDPSQKELYEIGYFIGSGTSTDMHLDIFPEDTSGIPTLAMDVQTLQSDAHDQIIQNKARVRSQIQAKQYGVSTASSQTPTSTTGFELSQEELAQLLAGNTGLIPSSFPQECVQSGSVDAWNWTQALGCVASSGLELSYRSSERTPSGPEFERYIQAIQGETVDTLHRRIQDIFSTHRALVPLNISHDPLQELSTPSLENVDTSFSFVDTNTNGVSDTYESPGYTLDMTVSGERLYTGDAGVVRVSVSDTNGTIPNDSLSRVQIDVVSISDLTGEDAGSYTPDTTSDWSTFSSDYLSLQQNIVSLNSGTADIAFLAGSQAANIQIRARIYDASGSIVQQSPVRRIQIQEKEFEIVSSTNLSGDGLSVSSKYRAGDGDGIYFRFVPTGTASNISSTFDLSITDVLSGEEVASESGISLDNSSGYHYHFDRHASVLTRAGSYLFSFSNGQGIQVSAPIRILPAQPQEIQFSSSDVLIQDVPMAGLVQVFDAYGNLASGYEGTFSFQHSRDTKVQTMDSLSQDFSKNTSLTTIASDVLLQITSEDTSDQMISVTYTLDGQEDLEIEKTFSVVSDVKAQLIRSSNAPMQVGGNTYELTALLLDGSNKIIPLDISLPIRSMSSDVHLPAGITFSQGRGKVQLTTGTKTVSDIRIVSPMGLEVIANDLSIRSGSPAGIQLYGDVSDMLTSSTQGVNMELNMYDLYGNVYDGDQIFSVDILVDASNTLTVPSDMVSLEVGKETQVFSVYPNNRAGRGFVYANIRDDAGQLLAGSDVYPITVYTSLSERNIGNMDINVVKSYLLGESYGDMTQEKYLAGEWLYSDADTRTLSVTSLSDTPYQTLPWFHLQPTGEIVSLATPDGVVPPVVSAQIVDGYIETTVSDGRQNSHIATLLPRFTSDAFLYQGCNGQSIVDGICDELPASNYVFVASAPGIDLKGDEQGIYFVRDEQTIASVQSDGRISGAIDSLVWQPSQGRSSMRFALYNFDTLVGYLEIQFDGIDLLDSVDQMGDVGLGLVACSECRAVAKYGGSSTHGPIGYDIVSEELGFTDAINAAVTGGGYGFGYAQASEKKGLGWDGPNGDIRDFSSGQFSAESLRTYQDFITIHHGDPVVQLETFATTQHGFDGGVGTQVYASDREIADIAYADLNHDGDKDLVVVHSDGSIGLRLDPGGDNLNIGDVAQLLDLDTSRVVTGDFFGDGYADIAFTTKTGKLQLLTNDVGVFDRSDVGITGDIPLDSIRQLQSFDMDRDGFDDLVILDDIGSLYILYGNASKIFTVQYVEKAFSIQLDSGAKREYFHGGVRFEGAGGIGDVQNNLENDFIETLVYQEVPLEAEQEIENVVPVSLGDELVQSFNLDPYGFFRMADGAGGAGASSSIGASLNALQDKHSESITVVQPVATTESTTQKFIKSAYINPNALVVRKQYAPAGSSDLIPGAIVDVTISLENTSNETISEIQLVDVEMSMLSASASRSFSLVQNGVTISEGVYAPISTDPLTLTFNLTDTLLEPDTTLEIRYQLEVQDFDFGEMRVGFLEHDSDPNDGRRFGVDTVSTQNTDVQSAFSEDATYRISESDFVGEDIYGDIVFSMHKQCQNSYFLWRSHNTSDRTYAKTFVFDDAHIRLAPGGTGATCSPGQNSGVDVVSPQGSLYTNSEHAPTQLTPHEELVASMHGSDPDELLEYYESEETIQNLSDAYYQDSDGDGIPDIHDTQETQYVTIAGDEVFVSDDIKDFVDDVNTSVARTLRSNIGGYGGGGGSQPINRVFNTPGNVASFLGHALRIAGHAHQDVLNGIPTFSIPSKCDATSYVPKDYPGGGGSPDEQCGAGDEDSSSSDSSSNSSSSSSSSGTSGTSGTGGANAGGASNLPTSGGGSAPVSVPDFSSGIYEDFVNKLADTSQQEIQTAGRIFFPTKQADRGDQPVDGTGNSVVTPPGGIVPGVGISKFRIFQGATLLGQAVTMICMGPNTMSNPGMIAPTQFPVQFGGNCIYSSGVNSGGGGGGGGGGGSAPSPNNFQYEAKPYVGDVVDDPQALVQSDSFFGNDVENVCVNNDSHPGSENTLLYNSTSNRDVASFSCGGRHDRVVVDNLRSYVQEILYGSGNNVSGTRDQLLIQLSENTELLTDDVYSGVEGSPLLVQSNFEDSIARLQNLGNVLDDAGVFTAALSANEIFSPQSDITTNVNMRAIKGFPNFIMGWFQDQMDEVTSSIGNLSESETIFPESGGIPDPWHYQNRRSNPFDKAFESISQQISYVPIPTNTSATDSSPLTGIFIPDTHAANVITSEVMSNLSGSHTSPQSPASSGSSVPTKQFFGGETAALQALRQHDLVYVTEEKSTVRIPHMSMDQADAWLARNQAMLETWKNVAKEGYPGADAMVQSIEKNIQTVQSYRNIPLQIQEYMHHREKYLYDKLGDVQEAQDMMYRWQLENGESLAQWNQVHDYNRKQLGNYQEISNILHKFDQACGHRNNERHSQKYQRWKSLAATMPKMPVVDGPRFPDQTNDFSAVDQSIDVRVPVIDFEALPLELPDAPTPNATWNEMEPMTLFPGVPDLPKLPEASKASLPNLPSLPPASKVPQTPSALTHIASLLTTATMIECIYDTTPITPEWYGAKAGEGFAQRKGYLPIDYLQHDLPQRQRRFIDDAHTFVESSVQNPQDDLADQQQHGFERLESIHRNMRRLDAEQQSADESAQADASFEQSVAYVSPKRSVQDLQDMYVLADAYSQNYISISDAFDDFDTLRMYARAYPYGFDVETFDSFMEQTQQDDLEHITRFVDDSIRAYEQQFAFVSAQLQNHIVDTQNISLQIDALSHSGGDIADLDFIQKQDTVRLMRSPEATSTHTSAVLPSFVTPLAVVLNEASTDEDVSEVDFSSDTGVYLSHPRYGTTKLTDYLYDMDPMLTIMADVDSDTDVDIFYVRDTHVYLKKHQQKEAEATYVNRRPKVYEMDTILEDIIPIKRISEFGYSPLTRFLKNQYPSSDSAHGQVIDDARKSHVQVRLVDNFFSKIYGDDLETQQHIVDILDRPSYVHQQEGYPEHMRVRKTPAYVSSVSGISEVLGAYKVRTIRDKNTYLDHATGETGSLDGGLYIRPGRSLYTLRSDVLVEIQGTDGDRDTIRIPAFSHVMFDVGTQVYVVKGSLLLVDEKAEWTRYNASDLLYLPILSNTSFMVQKGSMVEIRFDDDTTTSVPADTSWTYIEAPQDTLLSFSQEIDQGFYYGTLSDIHARTDTITVTPQELFSVQKENDRTPVQATIPEQIFVSRNSAMIDFADYVSFDEVDRVVVETDADIQIDQNTRTQFVFSEMDAYETIALSVQYYDIAGNVSQYTTELVIQAPNLQINQMDYDGNSVVVSGVTDTALDGSSVLLYASGAHEKILEAPMSSGSGDFRISASVDDPTFEILMDDVDDPVGTLSFIGGKNEAQLAPNFELSIGTSEQGESGMFVLDTRTDTVVTHLVPMMQNPIFAQVSLDDLSLREQEGIYLTSDTFSLVRASMEDPNIPDGMYIVDNNGNAIMAFNAGGAPVFTSDVSFTQDVQRAPFVFTFTHESGSGSLRFVFDAQPIALGE